MKNLICFMSAAFLFVSACNSITGENGTAVADQDGHQKTDARMVMLHPSIEEETRIQQAVDNGGQTWRLNSVDVAHASLVSQGVNVRIEDCRLLKEDAGHAVVHVQSEDKDLNVYAERIVRPGGIWTATQIEVNKYKDPHAAALSYDADHNREQQHH
ncbi:MAG: hypothetical protein HZA18_04315 [Nitrospirae bacterium]|nr:hypothetical protein [Nitrospirota bacterium]